MDNFFKHLFRLLCLRSTKTRRWPRRRRVRVRANNWLKDAKWALPSASKNAELRKKACTTGCVNRGNHATYYQTFSTPLHEEVEWKWKSTESTQRLARSAIGLLSFRISIGISSVGSKCRPISAENATSDNVLESSIENDGCRPPSHPISNAHARPFDISRARALLLLTSLIVTLHL